MPSIVVSLAQMHVEVGRPELNLETARTLAAEARARESTLLLLPELWPVGYDLARWRQHAVPLGEGMFREMSHLARDTHMRIGGTLLEADRDRAYNTFALFDSSGGLLAAYRKVHLFHMMGEDRWLAPGDRFVTADLEPATAGLATCYDLRFPEMFRMLTARGATVLLVPAAWPEARIRHWSLLLRARAIENQCFVLGCNCTGQAKDQTFGGLSAVIDPWGETCIEAGREAGLITTAFDLDLVDKVRTALPALKDRRPELY
jgi:omega-amidase